MDRVRFEGFGKAFFGIGAAGVIAALFAAAAPSVAESSWWRAGLALSLFLIVVGAAGWIAPRFVVAKPDFRVTITNLTVLRQRGANPIVVAQISVTNHGHPAAIEKWQMKFFRGNEPEREAGRQDLQHKGLALRETRLKQMQEQIWGYDEFIEIVTAKKFTKGEPREGFYWAELCDSLGISESDLRKIYMQYQSEHFTFSSASVGANLDYGAIEVLG